MNKHIEKQIFNDNLNISDLVKTITDIDIKDYVEDKISKVCVLTNDYTERLSEQKQEEITDWLEEQGYKVVPVLEIIERYMSSMSEIDKLTEENQRLRHNVSVLQKKLNERI
jgi:predicted house-cleaning noncanonical NTP pyrophosphatase (MazG superfamily)